MISRHVAIYALLSGCCMLMSNAILIVLDRAGAPLSLSVSIAFAIVVVAGYVLHSLFTFRTTLETAVFVRYTVAMSVNIPLAYATLWLWRHLANLPIEMAAPLSTTSNVAINFALCRFTVFGRRRAPPSPQSRDMVADP